MLKSLPVLFVPRITMNRRCIVQAIVVATALFGSALFSACTPFRNFTTYFNLFYNMERIMQEVEDELLYTRELKAPEPVFVIPYDDLGRGETPFYDHLERRTMTAEEARANKVKLDSILLKGSKLLAYKNRSDYVDDALFFMGKTYFYQREWFLSQKKCEEMISNFPESPWLPDAHLLYAMDLMHLGNPDRAAVMLSRTIDIAWARQRADVLTEAFRLNADLALAIGDIDKALRPYYRALIFGNDDTDKGRWQYEIGMIYFRRGLFEDALTRYDSVDMHSPDIVTQFQTGIQRGAALRALGRYDEASTQLDRLEDNGNFEPWWGMVAMERLNLSSVRDGVEQLSDSAVAGVDSVAGGRAYTAYIIYERGVRAFRSGDYKTAMENFARAQTANAPFQRRARTYALYLTQYFDQTGKARSHHGPLGPGSFPDSIRIVVADHYYNAARVFVNLDVGDSIDRYYLLSHQWSPVGTLVGARAIYALSARARELGRRSESDSLLEILVNDADYSLTEYAIDARRRLGYTENARIDPAEELYLSGKQFAAVGDNQRGVNQFNRLVATYPTSSYAPLALYAIGLLYEGPLENTDSAYHYYVRLVQAYPGSDQAGDVRPLLEAYNIRRMQKPGHLNGGDSSRRPDGLVPLDQQDTSVPRDRNVPPERPESVPDRNPQSEPILRPPSPEPRDPRQPN